ncbi:MAG: polysaccharide deacetylase family protein [Chryseolinea sp.]
MLKSKHVNWLFAFLFVTLIILDLNTTLPPVAYIIAFACYVVIQAYGSAVLAAEFFVPVKWKGPKDSNEIALTFDDGPVPGSTESILQILKTYNTSAAFFCIGKKVEENQSLVRHIHDSGHLVCNHSYSHKFTFDLQSSASIFHELENTDRAIKAAIGMTPVFFRPPYGVTNPMVASAITRGKYITIGWSIRSLDTAIRNRKKIIRRITRSLKGGDVILLHDHGFTTLEILPALIEHIRSVGLKIVRIDDLLKEKAYA